MARRSTPVTPGKMAQMRIIMRRYSRSHSFKPGYSEAAHKNCNRCGEYVGFVRGIALCADCRGHVR
jgi:ribosomal protein S14